MDERAGLRRALRASRRALPDAERRAADKAINDRLIASAPFQNARRLALYSAFDGEPDLRPSLEAALAAGKRVCLPRMLPQTYEPPGEPLRFHSVDDVGALCRNRAGILEPPASDDTRVAPHALDLVVLPLVGFDRAGNRLGLGAGCYDRTFAFVAERRQSSAPRLLGVAYELQRVERLDAQPWDVPLWGTVTEQRLYTATR